MDIKIYEIKGKLVMLDSDLAKIYECKNGTKEINQAVRNNKEKFSNDISWVLSDDESRSFLVKNFDQKKVETRGGKFKNPRVFTKEGVEVLNTILKSKATVEKVKIINDLFKEYKQTNMSFALDLREENIKTMIYEIRGKQVMLDSDLAILYNYKEGVKALNQTVKRNIDRFPNDFYFKLTDTEFNILRSQIVTAKKNLYMIRSLPYVFTEEGVAMLSTIIRTNNAAKVSVSIMRAFVEMRHFLMDNQDIYLSLNNINNKLDKHEVQILEHDNKFEEIFEKFNRNEEKEMIYFEGQIYDAYSKLVDIMSKASNSLVIIDGYADKIVLDMISRLDVDVYLIIRNNSLLSKLDISKYNEQYNNLKVIYSDLFHDRYIIIDDNIIYHCGSSLNKAGTRIFSINKLEDKYVINGLLNKIREIKKGIN